MTDPAGDEDRFASLRSEVRAALASRLEVRDPAAAGLVLGAGSDDFESGRRYLKLLADGGWAVPSWPTEHGGMGLAGDEADVVREVVAEFDAPDMYPFLVGLELIGPTILAHASEEQKARWLPGIRDGSQIWCQMFSEPDAGSDLANVKTKAVRDGDGWRVSGSKVWTSRAHYSQWGLLLARTDPSVPKHAGITAFAIDLSSPGVTVRPLVQMNGDAHFNEVFLDDVVVPDADRIDEEGRGWKVGITCLSFERGSLAGDQGITVDRLIALGRANRVERRPVERDRLVQRIVQLRVNQMSALRAAAARQAGKAPGPEDSGAKIQTTRMVKATAALALDLEGPAATVYQPTAASPAGAPDAWQTMFLVSPSLSIRGGTDEIQHNILGERVLGLPPEPRVDKARPFSDRPDQ
ncbi:acyl-CoA dehydrogenase family protein [Acidiferrimicrobium sp. IK]|uniref:acyl-CoA dehydrogenase family protein n=1 Tax=Acidiferrimicrobium sp. IK TaxID=2871700 RepID=UPI0021CB185D|nr:acyl-CoA dehydrogenase family protein [Acidiferrimicrobium sp. IK]MCU4184917.1 acyl-CoA dehydrogenase family protein [Acidiferrimicrobium sp. IK]